MPELGEENDYTTVQKEEDGKVRAGKDFPGMATLVIFVIISIKMTTITIIIINATIIIIIRNLFCHTRQKSTSREGFSRYGH